MKRLFFFGMLSVVLLGGMANTTSAITDTMDSGWTFSWIHGSDGYAEYGYSSAMYTSAPTSIYAEIWAWGTRGQDTSHVKMEKTFPWVPGVPLTRFKINYLVAQMTDGDAWGGMAAFDKISIIMHDDGGDHKYTYAVVCSTTNTGDWAGRHCSDRGPNFKYIKWNNQEISAPGHGELEPPLNTWYTLDRNVDDDFIVDWSTVTEITILIEHHAGYLHADRFETYFDDLELTGLVPLDIKPQSCPNPLTVRSRGVLPAAVLGTADFDVTTIDPASILLLDVAPLRSDLEDVAAPFEPFVGKRSEFDCTDEGPDGFLDLTLKFDTQEVVLAIEALLEREVEDGEVLVLSFTGNLLAEFGSTPIAGEDVVVILKRKK